MTNPKIVFFPEFKTKQELQDRVARASWYLSCLKPRAIQFFTNIQLEQLSISDYFHPSIKSFFKKLKSKDILKFTPIANKTELKEHLDNADIIICWQDDATIGKFLGKKFEDNLRLQGKNIYQIWPSERMEGSFYIEISKNFFSAKNGPIISKSQEKFLVLTKNFGYKENAFLFATGPSIKDYCKFDFSDGVSIICNSIINDNKLLEQVKPELLVFGDPIFHFGCSSYAYSFHEKLRETAERYDFKIIIPLKYYHLFVYNLPEFESRTIAIPYGADSPINLNLDKNFYIKTTDNILTFLMLPLASTLAKNIYLLGCDGRPLDENDYFWKHNDKTQFTGEMESIKKIHPSFFKLEYNEYYLRHCDTLENYFLAGEQEQHNYISLTFSYIPALIKRKYKFQDLLPKYLPENDIIVSINPDLQDEFGHFLHYDLRLREAFGDNMPFISLCSKDCKLDIPNILFRPLFTTNTWKFRKNDKKSEFNLFVDTLTEELKDLKLLKGQFRLFMYTGDIRYLSALFIAITHVKSRKWSLSINLFWAHFDVFEENFTKTLKFDTYKKILDLVTLLDKNIGVFVDSKQLQSKFNTDFNINLPLWPMIGVTNYPASSDSKENNNEQITVFCPATGQYAKGFDKFCQLIELYNKLHKNDNDDVNFIVRNLFRDSKKNNQNLTVFLENISHYKNVKILDGILTEKKYVHYFGTSDIILLPYRSDKFYSRTSGCLVDALYFKKVLVVANGTWMGNYVKDFNAGETYIDGDLDDMLDKLLKAIKYSNTEAKKSIDHSRWEKEFSPQNLANLILAQPYINNNSLYHLKKYKIELYKSVIFPQFKTIMYNMLGYIKRKWNNIKKF
jgi:hypothetical protein